MTKLRVKFTPPDAGWIYLSVDRLTGDQPVCCSYLCDPFEDLLNWLEQIAEGSDAAVWHVAEEGPSARFIFLAGRWSLGDESNYLVFCRSDGSGFDDWLHIEVQRPHLIAAFYEAFRRMSSHANYVAREWEIHPRWHEVDQEDEAALDAARADWPFSGEPLRGLRSLPVEHYLALQKTGDRQLTFWAEGDAH